MGNSKKANPGNVVSIGDEMKNELEVTIRERAYELYEMRGREDGHDIDDWLKAELELRTQMRRAAA